MEKPDFQALSAELPDCPIGEIEMQLDEMLENFKQGEPNAAKWFVFVDKVKRNCLKLSLSEERQAVIVEWAKYARFDLNKQLSGALKGTIAEDGSLVLEEPPRVVSETWKRISARAAAPFPSLEVLDNESPPTTSSVSTSAKLIASTVDKASKPFTVGELALFCVYSRKGVTKENAKNYLEAKLNSGIALYNKFTHYSTPTNRTGFSDETALVRKNMIARIQKVLPRLNDEQKQRAEDEIHTLAAQN